MNLEFLVRNVGQRITPELMQGLAFAIGELVKEEYGKAYQDALARITAHEGKFNFKESKAEQLLGGYIFRQGNYEKERESLAELQQLYLKEIHGMDEDLRASLTHGEFIRKERASQLAFFVVEYDKLPVGYMIFLPSIDLATRHLIATELQFFLHPVHRKGWLAIRFLRWAEKALQEIGVKEIHIGAREARNVSPIYKRLGYSNFAYISAKVL